MVGRQADRQAFARGAMSWKAVGGWCVWGSVLGRQNSLSSSWWEEPEIGGAADVSLEAKAHVSVEYISVHSTCHCVQCD